MSIIGADVERAMGGAGRRAIGLGIAGLGRGLMLSLPGLRNTVDLRLAATFDPRREASSRFAEEHHATAHPTLEALLADPAVDAVYVASPHEFHASQTIAALEAGRHVLVEKPMAVAPGDGARMVDAARAAGRVLMVGPSHGFDAPVQRAAELVASGRYGAVRMVTAMNFTDFMYRPRRPEELDAARGGGVAYSQAAHQIDVVRRLVGSPVASLRAGSGDWDPARPSDGAYAALMTFADGAVASLTYSGYAHYDSDELMGWVSELGRPKDPAVYGQARRALTGLSPDEEASAKLSRTYGEMPASGAGAPASQHEHFGFVLVSCERADLRLTSQAIAIYGDLDRTTEELPPPLSPRAEVFAAFARAIRDEAAALHDGSWGLETLACCAALGRSSRRRADVVPSSLYALSPASTPR